MADKLLLIPNYDMQVTSSVDLNLVVGTFLTLKLMNQTIKFN